MRSSDCTERFRSKDRKRTETRGLEGLCWRPLQLPRVVWSRGGFNPARAFVLGLAMGWMVETLLDVKQCTSPESSTWRIAHATKRRIEKICNSFNAPAQLDAGLRVVEATLVKIKHPLSLHILQHRDGDGLDSGSDYSQTPKMPKHSHIHPLKRTERLQHPP